MYLSFSFIYNSFSFLFFHASGKTKTRDVQSNGGSVFLFVICLHGNFCMDKFMETDFQGVIIGFEQKKNEKKSEFLVSEEEQGLEEEYREEVEIETLFLIEVMMSNAPKFPSHQNALESNKTFAWNSTWPY